MELCRSSYSFFLDYLRSKDKQLEDLESKIAQLLAVMPSDSQISHLLPMGSMGMMSSSPSSMDHQNESMSAYVKNSQLNLNAG